MVETSYHSLNHSLKRQLTSGQHFGIASSIFSHFEFVGDEATGFAYKVDRTRPAISAGVMKFYSSSGDLFKLARKIRKDLFGALSQFSAAQGLKAVILDIRQGLVSEDVAYMLTHHIACTNPELSELCCIALLTFDFEGVSDDNPFPDKTFIPLINRMWDFDASLFIPRKLRSLYRFTPFTMPIKTHFAQPGWQELFTIDKGDLYIHGVKFGRVL